MQEDVENKVVRLAVQVGKLTFRAIYKEYLKCVEDLKREADKPVPDKNSAFKGEQTVKELIGQGDGISSVNVADVGLKDFKKMAKKYGVDFAIVKDKEHDPPRYTVFFKAKDKEAIDKLFTRYNEKEMSPEKGNKKPSILKKLAKFKEIASKTPRKVHEKRKEQER